MGDITNAMIAVANMRQDQQRTNLYAQNTIADNARQAFEFQQRQEQQMLARADALKQYRSERRDRLTGDFVTTLDKTIEAQKTLNTIRAQANAEAGFRGGNLSPLTQKSLQEAEGVFSALSGVSQRIQQQINSDDDSMEMLSLMTGGGGETRKYGNEMAPSVSGGEEASAAPADGVAPEGEAAPEAAPMDDASFLENVRSGLERFGLRGGVVKDGVVQFYADNDAAEQFYNQTIKEQEEASKMRLPAVVINRIKELEKDVPKYQQAENQRQRVSNSIMSLKLAKRISNDTAKLQAAYDSAVENGLDDAANAYFTALQAAEGDRVAILDDAIESANGRMKEQDEFYQSMRRSALEYARLRGAGPAMEERAGMDRKAAQLDEMLEGFLKEYHGEVPAVPAEGNAPKPGMKREEFSRWYQQTFKPGSTPEDLRAFNEAWLKYSGS